jgi:O-acetyl-ADP-ribose deacetylase (regulator of RNase III)
VADREQLRSIAFPNISTGVYRFPKEQAAEIAIGAVRSFTETPGPVEKIVFAAFDRENHEIYRKLL